MAGQNVTDLRSELGISTAGKGRIRQGISTTTERNLDCKQLLKKHWKSSYEVLPTEPLHDLKSHLSLIIPAAASIAKNETPELISDIQVSILNKITLKCSDYRKATVLIYNKLRRSAISDPVITELFQTDTEITHLMYTHDPK